MYIARACFSGMRHTLQVWEFQVGCYRRGGGVAPPMGSYPYLELHTIGIGSPPWVAKLPDLFNTKLSFFTCNVNIQFYIWLKMKRCKNLQSGFPGTCTLVDISGIPVLGSTQKQKASWHCSFSKWPRPSQLGLYCPSRGFAWVLANIRLHKVSSIKTKNLRDHEYR